MDPKAMRAYAELYDCIWNAEGHREGEQLKSSLFIDNLQEIAQSIGLETNLRAVGIPKEACEKMAKESMKQTRLLVNNPRRVEEKDALDIYLSAW